MRRMLVGLLAYATAVLASAALPITTRIVVSGGTANTASIAAGGSVTIDVRIDAPTVATIGASYRLTQTSPLAGGYFSITSRSHAGSPFNDPDGGTPVGGPPTPLAPDNGFNLGNNSVGLVGVAPASNILVTTITLTSSPATPAGTYRIQPMPGVSFATEVTTAALGNDVPMDAAFFDIVVTGAAAPGAPTGVTASAGDSQASVSFAAPGDTGGSPILGYTVTSSPPGGIDANAGSPGATHTIVGLTNGTAYTFTVTAMNAIGTGSPSAPSNSVTPKARAEPVKPGHIIHVAARGGDFTSIQSAISHAASMASPVSPVLVRVAPGVYREQLTLADFVDVEGAGPNATTITWDGAGGTVVAGAHSELRKLAVRNVHNASSPGANAIHQAGSTCATCSTRLRNVRLVADGAGDNLAVHVTGGTLELVNADVVAAASGTQTTFETALYASGAAAAIEFRNGTLTVKSGASQYAAYRAAGATIKIDNAMLTGTTFGAPLCFQTFTAAGFAPATCP